MPPSKIAFDADVIIHFHYGGLLTRIPEIIKPYTIVILDQVYEELKSEPIALVVDNFFRFLKIKEEHIEDNDDMYTEYIKLNKTIKGSGERACLVYARFDKECMASSNLKDVSTYCAQHSIKNFNTIDLLCVAHEKGIINDQEANDFLTENQKKGQKLPYFEINKLKELNPPPINEFIKKKT